MRRLLVLVLLIALMFPVAMLDARPAQAGSTAAVPAQAGAAPGQAVPLILLIDISSSMDTDDGSGVSRLESAKAGMKSAVDGRTGNLVGIWTYPGDGDCSAGGYVAEAEPEARDDSSKLKAIIENLSASGNTPTAQALEALGDDLTQRGFTKANIVLVSDGESNCDPPRPPCAVAEDLVSRGFDITINSIGFSISDAGRDELSCIADATGGRYVDVDNGEDLLDELQNNTNPMLEVTAVSVPEPAPAGGLVNLALEITNASTQQEIRDINVVVTFRQDDPKDVSVPVIPPRKKLGNLPPGESGRLSWDFSLSGVSDANQRARYRAVVYGRLVDGTLVEGTININEAEPAKRWGVEITGHDQVVVMGDSYSSGEGAEYEQKGREYGRDSIGEVSGCHVSSLSYARDTTGEDGDGYVTGSDGKQYRVKNLACSGAVIEKFTAPQLDYSNNTANSPQLRQLDGLAVAPRIVFLTIGGNDIGFSDIVSSCVQSKPIGGLVVKGWESCLTGETGADLHRKTMSLIGGAGEQPAQRLVEVYQQVWNHANSDRYLRARDGQYAPVVVLPYTAVADSKGECDPVRGILDATGGPIALWQGGLHAFTAYAHAINAEDVKAINEIQSYLNATIKKSVDEAAAGGFGIYYAAGVERATSGHTVCESDERSWFVPVSVTTVRSHEAMHPTAQGYAAISGRLRAYLASSEFDFDTGKKYNRAAIVTPACAYGDIEATSYGVSFGSDGIIERGASQGATKCDMIKMRVNGVVPFTSVVVTLHSSPVVLARLAADEDGVAEGVVQVPAWVEPGTHTITATGTDQEGNPVEYSQSIDVADSTPWFVWVVVAAGVMALIGAGVLAATMALQALKRRRGERQSKKAPATGQAM